MEDTLYTYTRMVFNQLGELGQTLLSFFIGVQSVDSVGRSNSNHQKTLLRFDPRGKSLSSSLFPSELGPGNFRQRGVAINPLPHSTRWSPSPKFFLFRRIDLPSLLSSPCTFHRKEMLRDSRSKVQRYLARVRVAPFCCHFPRYFYQEFFFSSERCTREKIIVSTTLNYTLFLNFYAHFMIEDPLFRSTIRKYEIRNEVVAMRSQRNKRGVSSLERIELNFLEVRKEERKREKNITYTLSSRK